MYDCYCICKLNGLLFRYEKKNLKKNLSHDSLIKGKYEQEPPHVVYVFTCIIHVFLYTILLIYICTKARKPNHFN